MGITINFSFLLLFVCLLLSIVHKQKIQMLGSRGRNCHPNGNSWRPWRVGNRESYPMVLQLLGEGWPLLSWVLRLHCRKPGSWFRQLWSCLTCPTSWLLAHIGPWVMPSSILAWCGCPPCLATQHLPFWQMQRLSSPCWHPPPSWWRWTTSRWGW